MSATKRTRSVVSLVLALAMIAIVFQTTASAGYNSGDDMDVFIDSFGNRNMVWRESVN